MGSSYDHRINFIAPQFIFCHKDMLEFVKWVGLKGYWPNKLTADDVERWKEQQKAPSEEEAK